MKVILKKMFAALSFLLSMLSFPTSLLAQDWRVVSLQKSEAWALEADTLEDQSAWVAKIEVGPVKAPIAPVTYAKVVADCKEDAMGFTSHVLYDEEGQATGRFNTELNLMPLPPGTPGYDILEIICGREEFLSFSSVGTPHELRDMLQDIIW